MNAPYRQRPQAYCLEPYYRYQGAPCENCGETQTTHYSKPAEILFQVPACLMYLEEGRKRSERRARIEKLIAVGLVIALVAFAAWSMSYSISHSASDLPTAADAQTWKTP